MLTLFQPALFQVYKDLGSSPAQDGDARSVRRKPGGDGATAGQGGRQHNDRDGQLRPASRGHGDEGERPGPGLRVHGGVHRVCQAGGLVCN